MRDEYTNLQTIRIESGYTQAKLSTESGIPINTIACWEGRTRCINSAAAESLRKISMVLGCTVEDLMEDN